MYDITMGGMRTLSIFAVFYELWTSCKWVEWYM